MMNKDYNDEKELEAIKLIDYAETLADQGKGKESVEFYEKAATIYLDLGSYIKIDELYIRIVEIISKFKNNIQAVYRLKSIIRKTEELKLYEVSAKLLIQLGNVSFRMRDWESAGEAWEKASSYLYEVEPEEFKNLSSVLLLKAGQSYERSSLKKNLGKRLIFKAVMKINEFDELYELEEKEAFNLLSKKEFEASAKKFSDIAGHFRKSFDNLGEIIDEEESKETMINAKARFIHFTAEYQAVAAFCLRASEDPSYNEEIKKLGQESFNLFIESISLLKAYLFPMKKDFDHEVVLRITFDTMLMAIIQGILDIQEFNPIKHLLENIEDNKPLIKNLKATPYYKITERVMKLGIKESLTVLSKTHLGHFENVKNALISFLR